MNYFEYQDYPKIDRSQVIITTNLELQTGSSIEQLKEGVKPYDYASFEKDAYITSEPKKLAPLNPMLGLISKEVSDSYGYISPSPRIEIKLNDYYSFSGITIGLVNNINTISVRYADISGATIKSKNFSPKSKLEFLDFPAESVARIYIELLSTKPYHFVGVYRIELGRTVIFDATNLVDANVVSHYDVDGSTIQYDVAELTIFTGENDSEYLFQKKQPIVYKDTDGKTLHKFYIENGENKDDGTSVLTAYDSISLLEDEYLGGIFGFEIEGMYSAPKRTYEEIVDDILSDTDVEYEISDSIKDKLLTGFLPISTRRKALVTLCKGTNTRVFKRGGKLLFKDINETESRNYSRNQIAENYSVNSKSKIGKLTVTSHRYSKELNPVELYNWYLKQGDNTMQMIKFDKPVYKIFAYEVTGVDTETGADIVSPSATDKVIFYHAPIGGGSEEGDLNICNYCIVKSCKTDNKIVIKGWEIIDDTNDNIYVEPADMDTNAEYDEITIEDVTLVFDDLKYTNIALQLFAVESQIQAQDLMLIETEKPNIGDNVSTPIIQSPVVVKARLSTGETFDIEQNIKVCELTDNLSGVYEVTAQ